MLVEPVGFGRRNQGLDQPARLAPTLAGEIQRL